MSHPFQHDPLEGMNLDEALDSITVPGGGFRPAEERREQRGLAETDPWLWALEQKEKRDREREERARAAEAEKDPGDWDRDAILAEIKRYAGDNARDEEDAEERFLSVKDALSTYDRGRLGEGVNSPREMLERADRLTQASRIFEAAREEAFDIEDLTHDEAEALAARAAAHHLGDDLVASRIFLEHHLGEYGEHIHQAHSLDREHAAEVARNPIMATEEATQAVLSLLRQNPDMAASPEGRAQAFDAVAGAAQEAERAARLAAFYADFDKGLGQVLPTHNMDSAVEGSVFQPTRLDGEVGFDGEQIARNIESQAISRLSREERIEVFEDAVFGDEGGVHAEWDALQRSSRRTERARRIEQLEDELNVRIEDNIDG